MAGGSESFPAPASNNFDHTTNGHSYPNSRPVYLDGQLTLPGYITAGEPTNKEIILDTVTDNRTRWKALGNIVFLAEMAERARPKLAEQHTR